MDVRAALASDYDAFARLFRELPVPDPTPSREVFEQEKRARMVIACEGDQVLGYAISEVLDGVGYVRNVVSAPEHRRRGVGRTLMLHLAELFVRSGARTWCLNVRPDNLPAVRLYESLGFVLAYASDTVRVMPDEPAWAIDVELEVVAVPPERDAALEQRFSLLPGQLRSQRSRGSRELLLARQDEHPVGVAVFDPRFAGAFPFRVAKPELGPAFFEHLRRRTHESAPFFQVVVEDDPVLRDALLAQGARVALHFIHMRAPLPACERQAADARVELRQPAT